MTRDDIIRMALEAGFEKYCKSSLSGDSELDETLQVEEFPGGEIVFKFAALVAAAERERRAFELAEAYRCGYETGIKKEREACAKVCDGWLHADGNQCAAAIRERGKK